MRVQKNTALANRKSHFQFAKRYLYDATTYLYRAIIHQLS